MQTHELLEPCPEYALLLMPRVVELQIILKKPRLLRESLSDTLRCPVILARTIVKGAKEWIE
jgi:hypothetical protein